MRAALRADLDTGFAALGVLRAYRALRRFDDDRLRDLQLRQWLLTIARTAARNAARADGRRRDSPAAPNPSSCAPPGPSIKERVEQQVDRDRMRSVLTRLPEAQRTAVVLRHVVDLSHHEIDQVPGCPEGTARSHVARGLKTLRTLLTERVEG